MTKQVSGKSVFRYITNLLDQVNLNADQYDEIRDIVDEAQYGCCVPNVTVIWVDNDLQSSFATPTAYQFILKDEDGNTIIESDVDGESTQKFYVPEDTVDICLNVLNQVSSLPGGGFTIVDSNGGSVSDSDTVGEHCANNPLPLALIYIIKSFEGPPE